jgi:flagellin
VISAMTNLSAMTGLAAMNRHGLDLAKSMERLITGRRINRASDDPAGSVAVDSMKAELATLHSKVESNIRESKRLGALDGAHGVVLDMVHELEDLVVRSANGAGVSETERRANQEQASSILETIDFLANTTTFDGQQIATGLTVKNLGLEKFGAGGDFNLVDGDFEKAQDAVHGSVESLALQRATIGNTARNTEREIDRLQGQIIQITSAKSQIEDTDYAAETASMIRAQMMQQASLYVTKLAMQQHTEVLQMLLGIPKGH